MARWNRLGTRGRVVDRRGAGPALAAGGLGGIGLIIYLLISLLGGGGGFDQVLEQIPQAPVRPGGQAEQFEGVDEYERFASTVLGSNDLMWAEVFSAAGFEYRAPTLVLFRGSTQSACGGASAAVGPHYCPLDETIYLDETFFDELQNRFGAQGGDVAEAYVIAHEVGHHVQLLLGIMESVRREQQASGSQEAANELSVRLELQADCFAGVWAPSIRDEGVFLPGEIQEGIDAASAVGDDRIQEAVQGQVTPETWTHGSSAQRVEWFTRGFDFGDPSECETF